jgi:hypothetical protein
MTDRIQNETVKESKDKDNITNNRKRQYGNF